MSIESVWFNRRGGYTADVKVAPLLCGGRVGNTRSLLLVVNAGGGKVRQCGGDFIVRMPAIGG